MSQSKTDFITSYIGTMKNYIDSPLYFIEAAAYTLVSDLLGRFVRVPELPGRGMANTWAVLSSPPGRTRRSSLLESVERVRNSALTSYYLMLASKGEEIPKIEYLQGEDYEDTVKNTVVATLINDGSPEGITDNIADCQPIKDFLFINGEFGEVIGNSGKKKWKSDINYLLSRIAYGEGDRKNFSHRTGNKNFRILPPGTYCTLLAGMQYPEMYLNKKHIRQGIGRRIMWVYSNNPKDWRHLAPLNKGRRGMRINEEHFADVLVFLMDKLHNANGGKLIELEFEPDASDAINVISKNLDDEFDRQQDESILARQSLWEHYARCGVVWALSQDIIDNVTKDGKYVVTRDHLQLARPFMGFVNERTMELVDCLDYETSPLKDKKSNKDKVLSAMRRCISRSQKGTVAECALFEIGRSLNYRVDSDDIRAILDELVKEKRVKLRFEKSSGAIFCSFT